MYSVPEVYSASNRLCRIDTNTILATKDLCTFLELPCDENIYEMICIIMEEEDMILSDDIYDRVDMYIDVRFIIYDLL